ncbi:MAG: winged helix-turn-helix domain-containing protein [Proteobacteria bacterium]|nr:winged helix-turn-helix domain-containing protein [Pseudomonadota bacterium]MBS0217149.1 winged helix-turn-helix domain-containing protein [Pseudomonadota bacterium]
MSQPDPTLVAFDDVVVDLAGHRLLRGGMEQALEPKSFGVLILLIQEPGRVFSRDEIMDAVWGHRHVTPGVLNRSITLLRHALGEGAHDARYLHTVHGVGYRFDLPSSPDAESGPVVPADVEPTAPLPSRHALPMTLWLLALLALLVAGGWWWRAKSATTRPTTSTSVATPSLVIVPLKPIGDSESVLTIANGLSEELIGNLARINGLRVIARESTHLAVAESDDPTRLAQRLGITHVLQGSLQQAGQALRVHLRLVEAKTGHTLWARDFDRNASEVLLMQREIAESVATSLTLKLGLPTAPTRSGDVEFLRRFLAAQKMLHDQSLPLDRKLEPAEAEFRALLRERPDDARTHAALALALNIRSIYNHDLPASVSDDAMQEAITAQRLDSSLAEPYFIQAFIACQHNQWEPCVSLMHEADVRGMKVPPLANPAVVLARLGYLDRAEAQAREWIARDPLNISADFTLGRLLDTMGRHEEAKARYAPSRHVVAFTHYGHWFNAYWRKDYAEAQKLADEGLAVTDEKWPLLKPGYVATMRALTGQGGWADVDAANRKFEQDTGLFALLRVIQPDAPQHASDLIAGLERVRKGSYSTWDLVLWQKDFAFLRRDPAFQAYLKDNGILAYWKQHGFPKQCHPQGEGAWCG